MLGGHGRRRRYRACSLKRTPAAVLLLAGFACRGETASGTSTKPGANSTSESVAAAVTSPASVVTLPASATASSSGGAGGASSAERMARARCPSGMALVPGGTLRPRKRRTPRDVEAFCLDVTEVTAGDYTACVDGGACRPACRADKRCARAPSFADWGDVAENVRASQFCNGERPARTRHPMNCVSIEEAIEYCAARGGRLPRASEWEWAAQGARGHAIYPWGNQHVSDQLCWRGQAWRWGTCQVGSTPGDRSPQGILDLAGNVTEWVAPDGPLRAVVAPPEGGGPAAPTPKLTGQHYGYGASWYAKDDGYPRAAIGGIGASSPRNETFGFRCARDAS